MPKLSPSTTWVAHGPALKEATFYMQCCWSDHLRIHKTASGEVQQFGKHMLKSFDVENVFWHKQCWPVPESVPDAVTKVNKISVVLLQEVSSVKIDITHHKHVLDQLLLRLDLISSVTQERVHNCHRSYQDTGITCSNKIIKNDVRLIKHLSTWEWHNSVHTNYGNYLSVLVHIFQTMLWTVYMFVCHISGVQMVLKAEESEMF